MSALPSIWNIAVSTIVFFIAAWYVRRYLDEQDIPAGMTRSILVFTLASLASWGAGESVDYLQGKEAPAAATTDLTQLLNQVNQVNQVNQAQP